MRVMIIKFNVNRVCSTGLDEWDCYWWVGGRFLTQRRRRSCRMSESPNYQMFGLCALLLFNGNAAAITMGAQVRTLSQPVSQSTEYCRTDKTTMILYVCR